MTNKGDLIMNQYIKQVASPQILNEAWLDLPREHNDWCGELSMPEMQRNLIFHIGQLSMQLSAGQYRPEPMCCYAAQGANGEERCISTVRDQLVQSAILKVLQPLAQPLFNQSELAKQGQQGPELALSQIQQWVNQDYVWLGIANIKDCFKTIPHEAVLKNLYKLCGDKTLVQLVRLYLGSWPTGYRPEQAGIGLPRGLLLSPFLCELYLQRFEAFLHNKRIPFVRFFDDLIVLAQHEAGAHQALKSADKQLKKMGLGLNPDQSRVIFSSSDAEQALTLKALFSKGGLEQLNWARLHQASKTSLKTMVNKGRLLLKGLQNGKQACHAYIPALPWLKSDKLAASQSACQQSANVWQRMWKRRASWVR
jgi:RNA-directed DNA polymerase